MDKKWMHLSVVNLFHLSDPGSRVTDGNRLWDLHSDLPNVLVANQSRLSDRGLRSNRQNPTKSVKWYLVNYFPNKKNASRVRGIWT